MVASASLKRGSRAEAFRDGLWHPVVVRAVTPLEDGDVGYTIEADRWGGFVTSDRIRPPTEDVAPSIWNC